ncbi:MAG TPA: hypothetical protein VJ385_12595 [Fibrobacteria bacterium]|nr:hypothetical protein [Fibrobacteria bacterium]
MKNQMHNPAILGLGAAFLMSVPAIAQVRGPALTAVLSPVVAAAPAAAAASQDDDSAKPAEPSPELQKRIREQVAASLPVWDKRLLTSYETAGPWEDNLNYEALNKALGETPFAWEGRTVPPPDADRLTDDSKSMRIRRAEGVFRYHSRKREFSADMKGKPAPSYDQVSRQIGALLGDLKFPLAEAGKADVKTQEVAVSNEAGEVAERFPSYSFFLLNRKVEGIPVEGSTVRAAVNLRGEVQRLKIAWPHFRVRPGAELLSRERVLETALQKVFAQDPTERLTLASRLVYAKTEKGDFLPAVQVDVNDGETPYRMTIPVAL